jgi:hypothetical protein
MRTMDSLVDVDSNGVRQEVIDRVEQFDEWPTTALLI